MTIIRFEYAGPTDSFEELAAYRPALMAFLMENLPTEEAINSTDLQINAGIIFRLAGMAEAAEITQEQLNTGIHPQVQVMVEKYVNLRVVVEKLIGAESREQVTQCIAALVEQCKD